MKRTLTVNLNNIVFHIDDDAYDTLQVYLADVEKHLSDDEKREVMADIEARIAELFTERLQKNKNVVNIEDVEEIINILGKPSQYGDSEDETQKEDGSNRSSNRKGRRFYRDQDKAILGGVAAGLAAFLSWDITLVRIIFVILVFLGVGMMIPVYILVWLIAPPALTAAQRLEMQGEDVTAENIKTEINNVKNYMQSDKFKQSAGRAGIRIGEVIRTIFKALFTFIGAILGFAGVIVLGILILVLLVLIFDPASLNSFAPNTMIEWSMLSPEKIVLLIFSLLLVIGCPIFLLVYWIIRMINGRRDYNRNTYLVVVILWLAGLFMFYSANAISLIKWSHNNIGDIDLSIDQNNFPQENQDRTCAKFNSIDVEGNIELTILQDSAQRISINANKSVLPKVYTEVENGVLKVYTKKLFINNRVKVFVSVDSLRSVSAKGACEIKTEKDFFAKNFRLDVAGACKADMDMQVVGETYVEALGASKIKLTGNSRSIKVEANGASHINAADFRNKSVKAEANGASNITVYATDEFEGQSSGVSHIKCKGNPAKVDKDYNFGSSVDVD